MQNRKRGAAIEPLDEGTLRVGEPIRPVATCERISVQIEKKVSWNYQSRAMSLTETWTIPAGSSDDEIDILRRDRVKSMGKVMLEMLPSPDNSTTT